MFFKMITLENGYELSDKHHYKYFDTPMDYLQKNISKFNFRSLRNVKEEVVPFSDIIKPINFYHLAGYYYQQRNRIIEIVRANNQKTKELYIGYDYKSKEGKAEIKAKVEELKQECIDYLNNTSICETTMYLLLVAIEDKLCRDIRTKFFDMLFGTPNEHFFKMIKDNGGVITKICESDDGDIIIHDMKFKEV